MLNLVPVLPLDGGHIAQTGLEALFGPRAKRAMIIASLVITGAVAVWCFARWYYFAFYVIEHYVDPGFKFAGLGAFARYLVRRRPGGRTP